MIAVFALLFLVSASAMDLAPAGVAGHIRRDFEFYMSNQESVNGLLNQLNGIQGALGFADGNFMNQIAGELFLYTDIMDANPNHALHWQLKINQSLGVMRVIDVTVRGRANGNGRTLNMVGKACEIHQAIPQVFDQQEVCHKGKHQFVVFGHRKNICDYIQVPRGLNGAEINQVNQALINKIPEALSQF